jgi:hypothetical protein
MNLTPEQIINISYIIKSLNKLIFYKTQIEHNTTKYNHSSEQLELNVYDKHGLLYSGTPPCLGENINGNTTIASDSSIIDWVYKSLYKDVTYIEVMYTYISHIDGRLRYKTNSTIRLNDLHRHTIDEIDWTYNNYRYWDDLSLKSTEITSLIINKDTNSYTTQLIEHNKL